MAKKILIAGYTYIDASSMKTFDFYPSDENIYFLVPKFWPFKEGKYISCPPQKENVITGKGFFYHSNYPVIGGILKGFMPAFPSAVFKIRPDIVFSASEPNLLTTLYQGFFAKFTGAKHIIFTWENVLYKSKFKGFKGLIQNFIVKLNLFFCDGLVCGSKKSQEVIESLSNLPTAVIPFCGLDTDFMKRDNSVKSFKEINLKDNLVFSFAGAIGYRKGIHLIIKAFERLSKENPNFRLIIAGAGEYEQEIDVLIKNSSVQNHIIRSSWLDKTQLRELYNATDIFLYPSIPYEGWEEQFGYSLAEASLMELAVITTDSGSISELIIDGKTGLLINPDDADNLYEAMKKLSEDKEKRLEMGKAGREHIQSQFSHEAIAGKFHKFFSRFL